MVLEPGEVGVGQDRGDVPRRVGRVDDHERPLERPVAVAGGVELDRRLPLGGRLEHRRGAAVLEHQQLGQVAREAPGLEVAAVDADALEELLEDADLGGELVVEPLLHVGRVERRPVDGRPALGRGLDRVARDDVDVDAVDLAGDVRVLGERLPAVGQDGPAELEADRLEVVAVERRVQADEDVDVPVAGQPGVPAGAADQLDRRVEPPFLDRLSGPIEGGLGGRVEALALVGPGRDPLPDRVEHRLERPLGHGAPVLPPAVKGYRSGARGAAVVRESETPMSESGQLRTAEPS